MRVVVAITGATGAIYGIRLLEVLREAQVETHLVISAWGQRTIELETPYSVERVKGLASHCHAEGNQAAPISSGSFRHQGMVVAPCSMKTLAAVANGYASNLIHRAADVALKEHRKLILAVRETPLSVVHLENMLKMARLGVVIMPPVPAYYTRPQNLADLADQFVGRVLDQLGLENDLYRRWGDPGSN